MADLFRSGEHAFRKRACAAVFHAVGIENDLIFTFGHAQTVIFCLDARKIDDDQILFSALIAAKICDDIAVGVVRSHPFEPVPRIFYLVKGGRLGVEQIEFAVHERKFRVHGIFF